MRWTKDNAVHTETLADGQSISRVLRLELVDEAHGFDQLARVYLSHSAGAPTSFGVRMGVYRTHGTADVLVANPPLNDTEIEVLVNGPFSAIRISAQQLGGLGNESDSVYASVTVRRESA